MGRSRLPQLRFWETWSRERRFVVRRIAAAVMAAVMLIAVVWSTASAGRTLEAYRQPGDMRTIEDASASSKQPADGLSDTGSDKKNNADHANGTDSDDTSASTADAKDKDIARTLASDKSAQPMSDDERSSITAKAEETAKAATAANGTSPLTYTYCLQTKGDVGNTNAFANAVFSTLNAPQGWPRAGATFTQIGSDDCDTADMAIVLSEAKYMTTFSTGCSAQYSCRVGHEVIVNDDRWNGGVDAWLDAGGTLARYRRMVINHEVGHRLGHIDNETTCAGAGQRAPLMQEQSMHLDGCTPNEWPLDDELWIG